jgi:hypothetical protein
MANVQETWEQNERNRQQESSLPAPEHEGTGSGVDEVVQREAAEYDQVSKEERLLDGERATVNDSGEDS